eukprot:maker-scaffold865_size87005-snap-gene-0.21 protein:Tk05465 transcript:maker-scaffold865_size87005-snap-gene-0.21-mRNA-1 annotation:"nitrate reductase"
MGLAYQVVCCAIVLVYVVRADKNSTITDTSVSGNMTQVEEELSDDHRHGVSSNLQYTNSKEKGHFSAGKDDPKPAVPDHHLTRSERLGSHAWILGWGGICAVLGVVLFYAINAVRKFFNNRAILKANAAIV